MRLATAAGLAVGERLRKGGNGYLKSRFRSFCLISRQLPVFVLTDLDRQVCPAMMIRLWFRGQHPTPNLVFRIAVTEVESWVLADHRAISSLLGTAPALIPREPDSLVDPKATLIQLARRAPRSIRDDLVPPTRSIASQGLGYNTRLSSLIRTDWNPDRAAARSPSLRRARAALHGLANRLR